MIQCMMLYCKHWWLAYKKKVMLIVFTKKMCISKPIELLNWPFQPRKGTFNNHIQIYHIWWIYCWCGYQF